MERRELCAALFSLVLFLVAGCAEAPAPVAKAAPTARQGLERYMPLEEDFVYQYDVTSDAGETGRMMVHVIRPRSDLAELEVAGRVQRLEIGPAELRHSTGGYLLKAPLQVGAEWKGQFGRVRVVSVTRSIQTPAGAFADCVETVEEAPSKRATSVFCPDVGLVSLAIDAAVEGEEASVETRLRSYGPRATGAE